MRTENLIATLVTAAVLSTGGAFAQSTNNTEEVQTSVQIIIESAKIAERQSVRDLIAELEEAGFSYIEVHRTFLGRARLVAHSATEIREIILNPTTGEVLRDIAQENTEAAQENAENTPGNSGNQNGASGENGNKGGNGKGNNGNVGGGNRN